MSAHGLVTAALAVAVLGLGAFVVTRPAPLTGSADSGQARLAERVDALERETEKSSASIRALKRAPRRTARPDDTQPASPEGDATAPDTDRIATLEARVARLESRVASVATAAAARPVKPVDPATLDSKELYARAMSLTASNKVRTNPNKDFATETNYWEDLLGRGISNEQRDTALYNLGIALRSLKDHAREAETFEALIAHAGGMHTERGASAGFQLGWARWYQGDHARSLDVMDRVASSPRVTPILRYHALFRAGESAMKIDDPGRARDFFQRVLDDGDVVESQKWLLDRTKQYIADIDKR